MSQSTAKTVPSLYRKRLANVDAALLQEMIESSVAAMAPKRIAKKDSKT